jgi:hypothetical protein
MMSVRFEPRLLNKILLTCFLVFAVATLLFSQGLSPSTPSKEYMRLGGRVIAIENASNPAPPAVTITAPSAGATVSGTVTVTASASSSAGISSVQFLLNGNPLGSPIAGSGPYSTSWVTGTDGSYTLSATATDTLGQSTTSSPVTVTVSNASPTVYIAAPINGAMVSGSTTLTANASVSSPATLSSIQFQLDGANLGSPGSVTPYSITWHSSGTSNGAHTLTAIATDSQGRSTTSSAVSVTVSNGGSNGNPQFVTSYSSTTLRNDFDGWVGMSITVGSNPIGITSAGRLCVSGNSNQHALKFVNASSGSDVTGGSATVNMSGCATNQFTYASLSLNLDANTTYYLVSQEASGGDQWYDVGAVTGTSVAAINSGIYSWLGGWQTNGPQNYSYGPVNFQYGGGGSPPAVSITAPGSGATVSGSTTVTASASVSSPATLSSIQFQLDGVNLGSAGSSTPYSITWNTTTASNGSHVLTAIATDSQGRSTTSAAISVTVSNTGTGGASPFISSFSSTTLRNDFDGWVGMSITTGGAPLNVTQVGRICVDGNTETHTVEFVNAGTGVTAGSASVNTSGCTAGQFAYANLSLTLAANTTYYLVSQEVSGGDQWYEIGPVTGASVATINSGVYSWSGSWQTNGSQNNSYGPVNFQYSGGGGSSPTVSITAPGSGATVSGSATVTASASVSSPATLSSIQFQLDGANLGSAGSSTPYSITWNTTTASNGSHALTAIATDSQGRSTTSSAVSVTVSNGSGGGTPFITSFSSTSLRNDFGGWVGMSITTGGTQLNVTQVGRICVSGNGSTHTLKFVLASSGADVSGGSAMVNMAGCTANQFTYSNLSLTLAPNTTYYLVSQENNGGDQWYDIGSVAGTSAAVINWAIYSWNGTWQNNGPQNSAYVPLNFNYQ